MNPDRERRIFLFITTAVLIAITIPFYLAAQKGGGDHIFGGFLLNPIDGNSYLAKMRQGWEGRWRFVLPYTPEPGQGAYLFVFYIALGQLARLLRIPLMLSFDLARIIAAVLMFSFIYRYFQVVLPNTRLRTSAYVLAALGSGLGWLAVPFGLITSDLWVAEAYPFLSAYANPHFPLALALVLWLVTPRKENRSPLQKDSNVENDNLVNPTPPDLSREIIWIDIPPFILVSFLLALISPFGIVIVLIILGGMAVWEMMLYIQKMGYPQPPREIVFNQDTVQLIAILVGSLPVILYDFMVIRMDPALSGWNAQNITQSPPLWDLILSLSPALILSFWGAYHVIRHRMVLSRNLLVWGGFGLLLIFLPFGLQRRLMAGLFVPLCGLALLGIEQISSGKQNRRRNFTLILFLLALPTNLFVIMLGQQGASSHNPLLFLSSAEVEAFGWLEENASPDALVLASPETGLFIPAYTGLRVLYGHPFETVNAEEQERVVLQFFQEFRGVGEVEDFLIDKKIDLLFLGPREQSLGELPDLRITELVFNNRDVQIYSIQK